MLKLRAQLELEQYIEEQAVELTPELEIDTICPLISLLLLLQNLQQPQPNVQFLSQNRFIFVNL